MSSESIITTEYVDFIASIKADIAGARVKAALAEAYSGNSIVQQLVAQIR